MVLDMADMEHQLRGAVEKAAAAHADRDRAIAAASKAGLSMRRIAEITGLSHQRIHQIVQAQRRSS